MTFKYEHKKCVLDIETTGFNPWSGKIICIGIKDVDSNDVTIFHDDHEETLLIRFLQYFNKNNFREVIGFNVGFDVRYIIARCLRYRIPADVFLTANYVDLMRVLNGFKRLANFGRPGTLDEWSRFLLGRGKLLNNASVPALYHQGRITEILEYNKNDVEITYEIWKRINSVFGVYTT
jgi:uncharacterized protein YprB with RNaseH-like and TPR domain